MIRSGSPYVAVALASVLNAVPHAQQAAGQSADEIGRWTAAKVVHYHMVGVYAYREPAGQATVTDRIEIESFTIKGGAWTWTYTPTVVD